GYRLLAPPYSMGQATIVAIFFFFLFAVVASPLSGRLSDTLLLGRFLLAILAVMLSRVPLTLLHPLAALFPLFPFLPFLFFPGSPVPTSFLCRLLPLSTFPLSPLSWFSPLLASFLPLLLYPALLLLPPLAVPDTPGFRALSDPCPLPAFGYVRGAHAQTAVGGIVASSHHLTHGHTMHLTSDA
ncbi:hypothetical protein OIV57_33780, partial [Burkholderia pseudomallei]|nr:hypothetical protein [Burkholderia pseudomallei]